MVPLLEFRIPGLPPSVNRMYGYSGGKVYKNNIVKDYQKKMVRVFKKKIHLECPLLILLEYHTYNPQKYKKRDVDNFDKCVFDGLQIAGQIRNDNQVIFRAGMKIRDTKNFVLGYIYMMPECATIFDALKLFK
jgi:Holliday junction resolvase RusA-like endonuclease